MDSAAKILRKLLKLKPLPAMVDKSRIVWDEVNAILDTVVPKPDSFGQKQLTNFISQCISLIPQTAEALTSRKVKSFLKLLGNVLNHHVLENTTYVIAKGKIRKLIQKQLFSNSDNPYRDMTAWIRTQGIQFDHPDRTVANNATMKTVKEARMSTVFNITQQKLTELAKAMASDGGDSIILLTQLCLGVRIGEAIMASKFKYLGEAANLRTVTVKSGMPAPEIMYLVEQHGVLKRKRGVNTDNVEDTANVKCIKSVLYVNPEWLLTKLNEWRLMHGITEELIGTYNSVLVDKHNKRINKLLQNKYLNNETNKAIRIKTHLLRALYAASSFDLYGDPNLNQNAHNKSVLCHQDFETSASYDYVAIIPSDQSP